MRIPQSLLCVAVFCGSALGAAVQRPSVILITVDTTRADYDIYLIKADGTGAIIRLTNAKSMEFDPAWRPLVKP